MAGKNVMIVFWCRVDSTEKTGLAAALGAIQGRGSIRIRWVKEDHCDPSHAEWVANRARMEAEYIQPRPIDVEWAQGVVLASPPEVEADCAEWSKFFSLGGFDGKSALLIGCASLKRAAQSAGFAHILECDAGSATPYGKILAEG